MAHYLSAEQLARADLRREYGIARTDLDVLDAQDFLEALGGLTFECRFYEAVRSRSAATVEAMPARDLTPDSYLEGLRRHRGAVVVTGEV